MATTFFHLSPAGDDAGTGGADRPWRTPDRARRAVREALAAGAMDVTVVLHGGRFPVLEPLRFDDRDGGGGRATVTWKAAPGEAPELVGGVAIEGWERDVGRPGAWKARLPDGVLPETLFEDGERLAVARHPNAGYLAVAWARSDRPQPSFGWKPGDLPRSFDARRARVVVWGGKLGDKNDDWYSDTAPVVAADLERRAFTLRDQTWWPIGAGNRFFVQGAPEFLDAPGEFWVDRDGAWVHLVPRRGAPGAVVAPTVRRIIDARGRSPDRPVRGLVFEGLRLSYTDFPAAWTAGDHDEKEGAVRFENAEDCALRHCVVRGAGVTGVAVADAARRIVVEGNRIEDCGLHGVFLGGVNWGGGAFATPEASRINGSHRVVNNLIQGCGTLAGMGSGVMIAASGDNEVSWNRIRDIVRYGISQKGLSYGFMKARGTLYGREVTWENHWDMNPNQGNRLRCNDISEVMTDSSDGGAIEGFGGGRDILVEGNFIHDYAGMPDSWLVGIYLDDGCDYYTIRKNIVARIGAPWSAGVFPFQIKSYHNVLDNNIVSACAGSTGIYLTQSDMGMFDGPSKPDRPDPTEETVITRNVLADPGSSMFHFYGDPLAMIRTSDRNLFWTPSGKYSFAGPSGGRTLEQWRALGGRGFDGASRVGDPRFADAAGDDYRFLPGSPAPALGIETLDPRHAGLRDDFRWDAPRFTAVERRDGAVTLRWAPAAGALAYTVRWGEFGSSAAHERDVGAVLEATVQGLTNGKRMVFEVVPRLPSGPGSYTARVEAAAGPWAWNDAFAFGVPDLPARGWRVVSGRWRVRRDGRYGADSAGVTIAAATMSLATLEAEIIVDEWKTFGERGFGIVFGWKDDRNHWKLVHSGLAKAVWLVRVDRGREQVLASADAVVLDAGVLHRLRVEMARGSIRGSIDGRVLVEGRGRPDANGNFGLLAGQDGIGFSEVRAAK